MKKASSPASVKSRHMRSAKNAMSAGYGFAYGKSYVDAVQSLVRENIEGLPDGWKVPKGSGVAAVVDSKKNVVGGAVVGLVEFEGSLVAGVQHVVIEESHRGRGLGVVLVGVLHQLVAPAVSGRSVFWLGQCKPTQATFYSRSGFTVLDPGQPAPRVPGTTKVPSFVNGNDVYTCWFYRQTSG